LANRILDVKSEKFTKQNKENIENILNPLKEKIKTFEDKVEKSQKENISIHSALKEQLLNLQKPIILLLFFSYLLSFIVCE
jgi:DNA recombination protein RmuC